MTRSPLPTLPLLPPPPPPDDLLHTLSPSDTLMGLSLKYGCSEHAIRLANDLPSSGNLGGIKTLRIPARGAPLRPPPDEGASQRALLRAFRAATGLSEPEAKYYLGEVEWDLPRAQALLREHEAAETASGGGGRGRACGC